MTRDEIISATIDMPETLADTVLDIMAERDRYREALKLTSNLEDYNFCGLTGAFGNQLTKAINTARKALAPDDESRGDDVL